MKTYRVAIIGTGAIAETHVLALRAAGPRIELVAAVDTDPARLQSFSDRHVISYSYTDSAEMLTKTHPDLVFIVAPPATHLPLTLQCLEAGAWVNCEKPLCASLAEFDQIEAAEARSGCYVSAILQWRFGSAAQHVKKLIESGELGRPLVGVCQTLWYRDAAYYRVPWRGRWSSEFGGPTLTLGIHLMDLYLWLIGDWQMVRAIAATLDRAIEMEDVSMALLRFENGSMGTITNSALSPRQETYLRLDFQRASIELSALYNYGNAQWRYSLPDALRDQDVLARWQSLEDDRPGNHTSQVAALLDSMDKRERPLVSGDEARRIMEFIASLYKSAFTGQTVQRGSITPDDPFYHAMNGATINQ